MMEFMLPLKALADPAFWVMSVVALDRDAASPIPLPYQPIRHRSDAQAILSMVHRQTVSCSVRAVFGESSDLVAADQ